MNKEINKRIQNAKLTPTEAKVAEYISKHYYNICFTSAFQLGEKIGTSDASVIRTARKLGFKGYSDLQMSITEFMKNDIAANGGVNFLPPNARYERKRQGLEADDLYEQMLKKANENVGNILRRNKEETFQNASRLILNAKRKFVMGFRGTGIVANLIGMSLGDIYTDVRCVCDADSKALEAIMDITEDDCLILISFPRYAEMAITVAKIARDRKAKIVIVTDKITAPFTEGADAVLLCGVDSVSINNSYVAPVVTAEMLLGTIYKSIGEKERIRMKELEKYISIHGLY